LGNAKEGNWFTTSEKSNFDTLNILSQTISTSLLSINGALYQNAGATIVQQIAYSLVTNEYLIELSRSINPSF
jgi:methylmalonyl-CoA mutase